MNKIESTRSARELREDELQSVTGAYRYYLENAWPARAEIGRSQEAVGFKVEGLEVVAVG